jgi:hypothetical protein
MTMPETDLRTVSDVDVIAALRLAVEGTDDWEKLGQIASVILKTARDTPADNTGGVSLLLRLHREGRLRFDLTDADLDG